MDVKWYEHQRRAVNFAAERMFTMLAMETGTGKTPVALEILERWIGSGLYPAVVLCPNTLTGNWVAEAEKWGFKYRIHRLEGNSAQRRLQLYAGPTLYDVLVVNYESARLLREDLCKQGFKAAIYDEIHRCKDRRAKQTEVARDLAQVAKRRVGLTGTPIVHSPMDVWSEYDVLDPQSTRAHPLGYGSYSAMEKQIATVTPHPRLGMRARKIEFIEDQVKELGRRMARYTFEAKKDDCLDLPPRQFIKVRLDMLQEQERIYRALRQESVAYVEHSKKEPNKYVQQALEIEELADLLAGSEELLIEEGTGDDRRVSAKLVVTLMTRLAQVTSGFVKTDDGVERHVGSSKIQWLEEKLPGMTAPGHKAVVVAQFTHDIKALGELCERMKIPYVSLSGATSSKSRELVEAFQTDENIRVFIGQTQTTSTGLTLTAADYMVFYSNSFNAGDRAQIVDRIYRIGQTRKCVYYDLCEKGTMDEYILKNLTNKEDLAAMTVGELKKAINGE